MRIFGLGPMELLIIVGVVLLLFGPKIVPWVSKSFGKSVSALREGVDNMELTEGEDTDTKSSATKVESDKS